MIDRPIVMGILNVTPDSFHAASRVQGMDDVIRQAGKMIAEGAIILDIGGQSTRPGSERVSEEEELARVVNVVEQLAKEFPETFLSIDTFYARVAEEAIQRGASIVNDISAGTLDARLWSVVAKAKVPYVLMQMQGTPQTMQSSPQYANVTLEVLDFFIHTHRRLQDAGIHDVIIDPGFGFGKSRAHNFRLLNELEVFTIVKAPLLAGLSRKSMIAKTLGVDTAGTLNGTTALNTIALMKGACILRVHDVREAVETVKLVEAVQGNE
jgi:dihydropteroate synthase